MPKRRIGVPSVETGSSPSLPELLISTSGISLLRAEARVGWGELLQGVGMRGRSHSM